VLIQEPVIGREIEKVVIGTVGEIAHGILIFLGKTRRYFQVITRPATGHKYPHKGLKHPLAFQVIRENALVSSGVGCPGIP
jgi:hypothetical protein